MSINVKKFVPKSLKRPAKDYLLRRRLQSAIKAIGKLPVGQVPNKELLSQLITGWSNEGYAANLEYLEAVAAEAVRTEGPILECGTGATTILMGVICTRRNIELWSLENSEEWRDRVAATLESNGISGVHVCAAPLIEYGEFAWYDPPLRQMPAEFSLVICDGPPGATKGGRYGLLPIMNERLPAGTTILLDDAERPGEAELIARWESEASFDTQIVKGNGRGFAVMRRLG